MWSCLMIFTVGCASQNDDSSVGTTITSTNADSAADCAPAVSEGAFGSYSVESYSDCPDVPGNPMGFHTEYFDVVFSDDRDLRVSYIDDEDEGYPLDLDCHLEGTAFECESRVIAIEPVVLTYSSVGHWRSRYCLDGMLTEVYACPSPEVCTSCYSQEVFKNIQVDILHDIVGTATDARAIAEEYCASAQ